MLAGISLEHFGWRAAFFTGAIGNAVMVPVAIASLPESISFLLQGKSLQALERLNRVLRSFGHAPIEVLPDVTVRAKRPLKALVGAHGRVLTLVALAYFGYAWTFFYFLSWMPQLIVQSGHDTSVAVSVAVSSNLIGILGGVILGVLAPLLGLHRATAGALCLMGFAVITFGFSGAELLGIRLTSAAVYLMISASIAGLYTLITESFPANVKSTASGLITGMGRGVSALSPAVAGILYDAQLSLAWVAIIMSSGALASAGIVLYLKLARIERASAFAPDR